MGEQTEILITCIKEEEPKFESVFNNTCDVSNSGSGFFFRNKQILFKKSSLCVDDLLRTTICYGCNILPKTLMFPAQ